MRKLDEGRFLMEHHKECLDLMRQIELDGLPSDPEDVRRQFCEMVANAEGLRIAFGGQLDKRAVDDAYALIEIIRAASLKADGATHPGTRTRH